MITCPWCGTSYTTFQPNCDNCRGPLPLPVEATPEAHTEPLPVPPPAPRALPPNYLWRILYTDGGAITAGVFGLLGSIFGLVGAILTLTIVAAFVGLPFLGLGILFLIASVPLIIWRYQAAATTLTVLREGEPILGQIMDVYQNYHVQINGRSPWTLTYRFEAEGREYIGKVTTLSMPDLRQQPGKPVYVLHLPGDSAQNTLYPMPYGYYGL